MTRPMTPLVLVLFATSAFGVACGSSIPGEPGDGGPHEGDANGFVAAPDLRFKWVASGFGLDLRESTNIGVGGDGSLRRSGAPIAATPLVLTGDGSSQYQIFATNRNLEPMVSVAAGGSLPNLDRDLSSLWTPQSIVVSLDSSDSGASPSSTYNVIVNGTQGSSVLYLPARRGAVPVADLPAWVSTEGMAGRVVTALCPKDGGLFVTSFGRSDDANTYETQVATVPFDGIPAQLDAWASNGYVITAIGRDGTGTAGAGGFVLVGTRVAGRIDARSVKLVDHPCIVGNPEPITSATRGLFDEGYALVGQIFHGTGDCSGEGTWLHIGQR